MSITAMLADFSPTLSAELAALFGSLFFGAPLVLVLVLLARRRIVPATSTCWQACRRGFVAGGTVSIAVVATIFSIIWTSNLGHAGWTDYIEAFFGACGCTTFFASLLGALFGAVVFLAEHPFHDELRIAPELTNRDCGPTSTPEPAPADPAAASPPPIAELPQAPHDS